MPEPAPEPQQKPLRVETPLMAPPFEPLVRLYASKAGLGDDLQTAAIQLASLFQQIGIDPYEDPQRLQELARSLESLGTTSSQRLADELVARAGERLISSDYMERALKTLTPVVAQIQAFKLIERILGGDRNPDEQILRRMEELERRLQQKEIIEPLQRELEELRKQVQAPKEEHGTKIYDVLSNLLNNLITQTQERLSKLESTPKEDPYEKFLGLLTKLSELGVFGRGATQADVEVEKIRKEIANMKMEHDRQLEKDRREWQLQLEKLREARDNIRSLASLGEKAITSIGAPLASSFAEGVRVAGRGRIDLTKLSTEELRRARERAEQIISSYMDAKKQIEQELASREKMEVKELESPAGSHTEGNPAPSGAT